MKVNSQGTLVVLGDVVDAVGHSGEGHKVRSTEHGEGIFHVSIVRHPDVDVLSDASHPLQVDLNLGAYVIGVQGGQHVAVAVGHTVAAVVQSRLVF